MRARRSCGRDGRLQHIDADEEQEGHADHGEPKCTLHVAPVARAWRRARDVTTYDPCATVLRRTAQGRSRRRSARGAAHPHMKHGQQSTEKQVEMSLREQARSKCRQIDAQRVRACVQGAAAARRARTQSSRTCFPATLCARAAARMALPAASGSRLPHQRLAALHSLAAAGRRPADPAGTAAASAAVHTALGRARVRVLEECTGGGVCSAVVREVREDVF